MKKVLIIGAGPAGLTAAYELLKKSDDYIVIVFEESDSLGGISKTVNYKGNRMDMGGHRFFSKIPRINAWWENILPMQGKPAYDDILLGREIPLAENGPDPQIQDKTMLLRHRVSRILFDSNFYDYPISLKPQTFINMGFVNTVKVGFSYLFSLVHKLPETNLENFYINRFGKKLYSMFFEYYTENLWGRHPSEIDASWGAQRVKGLSITAILKDIFSKAIGKRDRDVETSLIEQFKYPKLGPGQLWETVAEEVEKLGGKIVRNAEVLRFDKNSDNLITSLEYKKDGKIITENRDIVISSMPLKDLTAGIADVPEEIAKIAKGLPYRDYMTLGILVKELNLKNNTKIRTVGNIIPDCWIYIQDRNVRLGRLQIYNNWSPYMVEDLENTVWAGLEYFVNEGDDLWNMSSEQFRDFAISEIIKLGIIKEKNSVLDWHVEKVKKAYPAYFDTYSEIDKLIAYLNTIDNLYCVGRNGQHRYNNIDHSMMTSIKAVDNILSGNSDKSDIWNVNTEKEYHESSEN